MNVKADKSSYELFELLEEQYVLKYLVYQTRKFVVDLLEPEIGEHVSSKKSYRAWFQHYDNHFKNELSLEEWNNFNEALEKEKMYQVLHQVVIGKTHLIKQSHNK